MLDLFDKKVLVTGASGMIASRVVELLLGRGATVIAPTHYECDLLNSNHVSELFHNRSPEYVVHCAGWNGGIKWNSMYPAAIFERTVVMGMHVLKACQHFQVKKVVTILTSCAYPDLGPEVVLREEDFWSGAPNPSVECHGFAKRVLCEYGRQLHKQFGLKAVSCILNNCYGPHDRFDENRSKVMAAFIKRFVDHADVGAPRVECWGTGEPRRELIYRDDAAAGIVSVLEEYEDSMLPVNIGLGHDIPIKQLAFLVAKAAGFTGEIVWDKTRPDGQMKKLLDTNRMTVLLPSFNTYLCENHVTIHEGIERTVKWYREQRAKS